MSGLKDKDWKFSFSYCSDIAETLASAILGENLPSFNQLCVTESLFADLDLTPQEIFELGDFLQDTEKGHVEGETVFISDGYDMYLKPMLAKDYSLRNVMNVINSWPAGTEHLCQPDSKVNKPFYVHINACRHRFLPKHKFERVVCFRGTTGREWPLGSV